LAGLWAAIAGPSWAESLKSADAAVRAGRDNSGRQLAMASPRPGKEKDGKNASKDESMEGVIGSARDQLVGQLKSYNISVPVPAVDIPDDMEKTCDTCYRAVRHAVCAAQEHSAGFGTWMARYFKQISGSPSMTPCGSPYSSHKLVPSVGHHTSKLYLTDEGRLKTVISR